MKQKSYTLLSFLTLILSCYSMDPITGLTPASNQYIVGDSRGRVLRIAFRTGLRQQDGDFVDQSNDFKINYANTNFFEPAKNGEQIVHVFKIVDGKYTWEDAEDLTSKFDLTLSINPFMVGNKELMASKFVAKESIEPFEACIAIKGGLPFGDQDKLHASKSSASLSTFCYKLNCRGQWVVGFDWENFTYILFSIIKILIIFAMIAMVFVRPFFPEYQKLRFIWIGQTIFFYQLLIYSPLTTGSFGGVIDEVHKGMIKAIQRSFFIKTQPKISDKFLEYAHGFQVYKYYDYDMAAALTEELFIGTILMIIVLIATEVLKFTKNREMLKIFKEMRSALGLVYFIPFTIFISYIQFIYAITGQVLYFWCIVNFLLCIVFFLFYAIQFMRMATTVASINYLHGRGVYQEGKVEFEQGSDWAFDTFPSMDTKVWMRIVEFLIYILLGFSYLSTYEYGSLAPFTFFILWIVLIYFSIDKVKTFETGSNEREDILKIIKLNPIITILRTLEFFIMGILNAFRMKLSGIKILTYVYLIILLADIVLIMMQLVLRVLSLKKKPDYVVEMEKSKNKKLNQRYQEVERREQDANTGNK